ncbi:hypothetical protein [Thioalkalivibrio sp. ALE16]|uniref:hypothetical protein n=1 Tax=Thioalkalivibrio sp. ALE16 TaxID=1158172 RepID=UPI0012DCBB8A|nr:hypothetical protein [Thioalkalivibrio sp. ALE16]
MHHVMVVMHGKAQCRVLESGLPYAVARKRAEDYIQKRIEEAYPIRDVQSKGIRADGAGMIRGARGKALETIWITPTLEHSFRAGA